MRIPVFILFLVLCGLKPGSSLAQHGDSVFIILRSAQPDTAKAAQLNKLFYRMLITGKTDELLKLTDTTQVISRQKGFKSSQAMAFYTMGRVMNEQGNYSRSQRALDSALSIYRQINDKTGIANVYNGMGQIAMEQGKSKEALEYYYSSLKILAEVNDKAGMSTAYNNIGSVFVTQGNRAEALKSYLKALELRESIQDRQGMSASLNNIGNVYYGEEDYPKALEYYNRSLVINKEFGRKRWISNNYLGIGSVYEQLKDYKKAFENYKMALEIKRTIGDQNGIAAAYTSLGDIFSAQKDFSKAKMYLDSSLIIAKEIGNNGMIKDTYNSLAKLSYSKGDYKSAYEYYQEFSRAKDSVLNEENLKTAASMQSQFELERKDNEIKLLNKENEVQAERSSAESRRQRVILWSVIGILAVVGFFSLLIYNRWKLTREQKLIIEVQQKNILDSIRYAEKIQRSVMPGEEELKKILPFESFVLFRPKDIVSGDFYWAASIKNNGSEKFVVAVGDCTGHGVPGAFLTMMGSTLLKEAISRNMIQPSEILGHIHREVLSTLSREKEMDAAGDGMDIAVCVIDPAGGTLTYAGAMLSAYFISSATGKTQELKADSVSIGVVLKGDQELKFREQVIPLEKGSCLYLFSDGYADQFSQTSRTRFGSKRFKELCEQSAQLSVQQQKEKFIRTLEDWKGEWKQLDDILVMGIRV